MDAMGILKGKDRLPTIIFHGTCEFSGERR